MDPTEPPASLSEKVQLGIGSVERRMFSSEVISTAADDIPKLIERPLIGAVQALYDRNIRTFMSSANPEANADGVAHIDLYEDFLSEGNKKVVDQLVAEGKAERFEWDGKKLVTLLFDAPPDDPEWVSKIDASASETSRGFTEQPFVWCPRNSAEEIAKQSDTTVDELIQSVQSDPAQWEEFGLVYDPETGYFFNSQEHIAKFHDSMKKFNHGAAVGRSYPSVLRTPVQDDSIAS